MCESLKTMERDNISRTQSVLLYLPQDQMLSANSNSEDILLGDLISYMLNGKRESAVQFIHHLTAKLEANPSFREDIWTPCIRIPCRLYITSCR